MGSRDERLQVVRSCGSFGGPSPATRPGPARQGGQEAGPAPEQEAGHTLAVNTNTVQGGTRT